MCFLLLNYFLYRFSLFPIKMGALNKAGFIEYFFLKQLCILWFLSSYFLFLMPVYLSLALLIRDIFHFLYFLFLCGGICCSLSLTLFWRMLLRLELIYLFFLLFLGRILCFLRILLYIFEMFLLCRFLWFFVLLCSNRSIYILLLLIYSHFYGFFFYLYILWILFHR